MTLRYTTGLPRYGERWILRIIALYLLKRQIESQGREFMKKGGFTENLYRRRTQARNRAQESEKSE